jgi:beta-N-acetylhexosaminidase
MFVNIKRLVSTASASCVLFFNSFSAHSLSLEEKIGQLLIVTCPSSEINDDCKSIINDLHVGGFIYYSWINPLTSKDKLKHLTDQLQAEALNTKNKIPLFISIDQEGGVVSRLSEDFTFFPGNFAIGKSNSYRLCLKAAEAMAKEMRFAGINLNFAPVVDVIDDRTIPYIGFRSFGSDPKKVSRFAKTMLKGFHNQELLGTLKHYPGHGSAKKDSHVELPIIEKSLDDLKKQDLIPFSYLKDYTDFIMTAHVLVPCLDPIHPVTISKKAIDYLKNEIGFKGVVITDSLTMEGLLKQGLTLTEAAIKAFNAGCDLLLIGGTKLNDGQNSAVTLADLKAIHQSLVDAVKTGIISEERLNESVEKILKCKKKISVKNYASDFKLKNHQKIAEAIAQKALHYHFNSNHEIFYNHYFLMTSKDMQRKLSSLETDLNFLSGRIFFDQKNGSENELLDTISQEDLIIFLSQGLKKNYEDEKVYKNLIQNNKKVFLIDLSENEMIASNAVGVIRTNNPSEKSLKLAIKKFKQELNLNH